MNSKPHLLFLYPVFEKTMIELANNELFLYPVFEKAIAATANHNIIHFAIFDQNGDRSRLNTVDEFIG